jgi:hypothetical protein
MKRSVNSSLSVTHGWIVPSADGGDDEHEEEASPPEITAVERFLRGWPKGMSRSSGGIGSCRL